MTSTRPRRYLFAAVIAAVALVCACMNSRPSDAQPPTQTLFGQNAIAGTYRDNSVELGVKFTVSQNGSATGVRFFKPTGATGVHTGYLYRGNTKVAEVTYTNETPTGWQEALFATPVALTPGTTYTASYLSPAGVHADTDPFTWPVTSGILKATAGVYKLGPGGTVPTSAVAENYGADVIVSVGAPTTTTPAPTPTTTTPSTTTDVPPTTTTDPTTPTTTTPPVGTCPVPTPNVPDGPDGNGGCWPGPANAGVPAGVNLTPYTGPGRITQEGTVIDGAVIRTDGLVIDAPNVTIRNSRIETAIGLADNGTATIEDTDVLGIDGWMGASVEGDDERDATGATTLTLRRVDVDKGQHSVVCLNCLVEDSYLHGQQAPAGKDTHNNAYWTGGGVGGATLRHNSVFCSPPVNNVGGGCSSDIFIGGDFGQPSNYTIDRNLYVASPSASYCGYFGTQPPKQFPNPTNIVVTNNVFQRGPNGKCGAFGPTDAWSSAAPGAVWTGNVWDDGGAIPAP